MTINLGDIRPEVKRKIKNKYPQTNILKSNQDKTEKMKRPFNPR
jgi:hypothetical protein